MGFDMLNCLILVFGIVLLFIMFRIFSRKVQDRIVQLEQLATKLGFAYKYSRDKTDLINLIYCHLFSLGHFKKASNLIQGRIDDLEVLIFDYEYTLSSRQFRRQSVICFHSLDRDLPMFHLQPKSLWQKAGAVFEKISVDFEDDLSFSARYVLRGNDEKLIRGLFTKDLRTFYLAKADVTTEVAENYFLYYRSGVRVEPGKLLSFIEEALDAFRLYLDAVDQLAYLSTSIGSVNLQ